MKKFLSEIESIFQKVIVPLAQLTPFAGLFTALFPGNKTVQTIVVDLKTVFGEIVNVSSIINTPGQGAARLAAAAPRIAALYTTAIDDLGLQVADEAAAATALTNIASNTADFLNACKKK